MPSIFGTVEFYIVCFVVGVAIAAIVGRPSRLDEARTSFATGEIIGVAAAGEEAERCVEVTARHDGCLEVVHRGVPCDAGVEPAIAIKIIGSDLRLTERVTPAPRPGAPRVDVRYVVGGLLAARYHLYFDSTSTGSYAAGSFVNEEPFHGRYEMVG